MYADVTDYIDNKEIVRQIINIACETSELMFHKIVNTLNNMIDNDTTAEESIKRGVEKLDKNTCNSILSRQFPKSNLKKLIQARLVRWIAIGE